MKTANRQVLVPVLVLVLAALVLADTKITAEIRSVVLKAVVLAARKADLIFLLFSAMIFFHNSAELLKAVSDNVRRRSADKMWHIICALTF